MSYVSAAPYFTTAVNYDHNLLTLGSLVITKFHKLKVASFTDFSSHLCHPGINFINILREQLMAVANKLVRFENTA
jgi:hypothetical protein